jgi:Putative beta barrel porin-7 (BBP7)
MPRTIAALLLVCVLRPAPGLAQCPDSPVASPVLAGPAPDCSAEPCEKSSADRWDVRGEYLLWWLREGRVPPLLTTGSAASQGVLGRLDTRVLYGGGTLPTRHEDRFNGTRWTLGYWLDDAHSLGIEGSAFFLERDSTYFKATSAGDTLLARPFFNAADGSPASEVVAGPAAGGARSGGFVGYSRVELFGEEVNCRVPLAADRDWCVDLLAGAHFLQMRDRLDLTAVSRLLPDQATLFGETDRFRADNRFYGGQAGLRAEYRRGRWSVNLRGEVALGATEQEIRAFGDRTFQTPLTKVVQLYGLAVLPSNRGTFYNTDFDVVSEVGVNLGYQVTGHLRLFAGYTFLAWANPVRAGDQVDLIINTAQLTGQTARPARPTIPFREEFFWAQGVNVGLDFHW